LNLISQFKNQIDLTAFTPINGTYLAGGDKGVAYSLLDEYLVHQPSELFPRRVNYSHAFNRSELIDTVLQWLRSGLKPVIKPHGTGIGHGIDFFLERDEPIESITQRIEKSLQITEEYYSAMGGAFPYTVCEFIDSDIINDTTHRLDGHKYELRIVVYQDGVCLKACPTIAKVASERFDATKAGRENLINNITNSSVTKKVDGTDYMLPLSCEETLKLLGIKLDELDELCRVATRYVRHVIDEIPRMQGRIRDEHQRDWPAFSSTIQRELSPIVAI
jgi:hypothetical protein